MGRGAGRGRGRGRGPSGGGRGGGRGRSGGRSGGARRGYSSDPGSGGEGLLGDFVSFGRKVTGHKARVKQRARRARQRQQDDWDSDDSDDSEGDGTGTTRVGLAIGAPRRELRFARRFCFSCFHGVALVASPHAYR